MNISSFVMLATLAVYFLCLLFVSRRTGRREDNDTFFRAERRSPWWMVGLGMIGASISGVSFISVPGWVATTGMTYLQMCFGFFVGYLVVAFVLLPLYYRFRLTSIYGYLGQRFGLSAQRTGSLFFLLSKLTCAAARMYIVVLVLRHFLVPCLVTNTAVDLCLYFVIAEVILLLIWGYTHRGGLFTIVRTDVVQTTSLLLSIIMMTIIAALHLGHDTMVEVWRHVSDTPMTQVFCWDSGSKQYFWRQFVSGIFIVIVMTGLDQSMMQKNLSCRTLREAQKNMCAYGFCFIPLNLLLLGFGVLLYALAAASGGGNAELSGDSLLPSLVANGTLGSVVIIPFSIGIVAAAFASADSALAALTTSCCIDLLRIEDRCLSPERQQQVRRRVHLLMSLAFLLCLLAFRLFNNSSLINTIYVLASYTYGPLLGLYALGLFTRRRLRSCAVLPVCLAAPVLCGLLDYGAPQWWGYTFGYELLVLNGFLTFAGLWITGRAPHASMSRVG